MRRIVAYVDDMGNCFPTNDHTHGSSILCRPELYKDEDDIPVDPEVLEMLLGKGVTAKELIHMKEAGII